MFNRFKLLVLVILLAIFTILFFQNQESLSLKFFCSDRTSEYCFYQTPSIALGLWMAIFIGLGVFSSLGWQLLTIIANSTTKGAKSSSNYSRISETRTDYSAQSKLREQAGVKTRDQISSSSTNFNKAPVSDWEQRSSEDWEQTNMSNFAQDNESLRSSSKKKPREPKYADKFSKEPELNSSNPWHSKIRQGSSLKESANSEDSTPKTSVSQETEDVYDANYRTLNNVPPPSISEDTVIEDEDPDWI